MSRDLQDGCALGVTDETLSALHDAVLSPDEEQRITGHVASCPVCSTRVERYARIGKVLREQRLSGPSDQLWEDVRSAIRSGQARPSWRGRWRVITRPTRPTWSAMGAVAAVLVVTLLFGVVLRSFAGGRGGITTTVVSTATSVATATSEPAATATMIAPPVVGTPLRWQSYTLPQGFHLYHAVSSLAVAPSDGNTAYMCYGPAVIVTHDHGAHWMRVSDFAAGSANCNSLTVDEVNPNIVVAAGTEITMDGGETWQHVTQPQQLSSIDEIATLSSRVYALMTLDVGNNATTSQLEVSVDGMRTWQIVDNGITGERERSFQVGASQNDLLAETPTNIWQSTDGGTHWNLLPSFRYQVPHTAERAIGIGRWQLCTLPLLSGCTEDGGQTWTPIPALMPAGGNENVYPVAMTSDGSLLWRIQGDLYWLPAGGSRWESRGSFPESDYFPIYRPVPPASSTPGGSGILWAPPPDSDGAGTIGAANRFYTASL